MIESFVDLTYRGLQLGRRVKLAQVKPTTGYLELATPMPVGTTIAIVTDEGFVIEAVVQSIHEQVGGSDKMPGMNVLPVLAKDEVATWWNARIGVAGATSLPGAIAPPKSAVMQTPKPEAAPVIEVATVAAPVIEAVPVAAAPPVIEPVAAPPMAPAPVQDDDVMALANAMAAIPEAVGPSRSRPITVRPRSQTTPASPPENMAPPVADMAPPVVEAPEPAPEKKPVIPVRPIEDIKKTVVMNAIDPAMLEALLKASTANTGEHPTIPRDDGKTMVMAAVDLTALGLDAPGSSGEMAAAALAASESGPIEVDVGSEASEATDASEPSDGDDDKKPTKGTVRRRRSPKKR